MVYPFANSGDRETSLGFLASGITGAMCIPKSRGGTPLTRKHLNGIGYFATIGALLDFHGYPYGIHSPAGGFTGYPKGAILISEDNDYVREYVSQIDDNTHALPSEGEDGTYEGNEYWKPTIPPVVDFFPSFNYSSKIWEETYIGGRKWAEGQKYDITIPANGWYSIKVLYTVSAREDLFPSNVADMKAYWECVATLGTGLVNFDLSGRNSFIVKQSTVKGTSSTTKTEQRMSSCLFLASENDNLSIRISLSSQTARFAGDSFITVAKWLDSQG